MGRLPWSAASASGFLGVLVVWVVAALSTVVAVLSIRPEFVPPETAEIQTPQQMLVDARRRIPPGLRRSEVIQPRDVLTIVVAGEPGLTNEYRVAADGVVIFPLIGLLPAGGFTPAELAGRLTKELAAEYLLQPQVSIEVARSLTQTVFVIGEVASSRRITTSGPLSLLEALALAGLPTSAAGHEVMVVQSRRQRAAVPTLPDDPDTQTTRVDLNDPVGARTWVDLMLQDGDTVYVPKHQAFYVLGKVRKPGAYVFASGLSVEQAIALAGGATGGGWRHAAAKITRFVDGQRKEISATPMDIVEPNDVVRVRSRFF